MKRFKFSWLIILFSTLALVGLNNCSKKTEQEPTTDKNLSDKEVLEKSLSEALVRLSYGDKSGLYDFEFPYLREETNYDEYLAMRQVQWANMDTVIALRVNDITYFGEDSVELVVDYVFRGISGQESIRPDLFKIYKYRDKWVKPTVSFLHKQLEFDEIYDAAIKAAEKEAGN